MNYILKNNIEDLSKDTIDYLMLSNKSLIAMQLKRKEKIIITNELDFSLVVSKDKTTKGRYIVEAIDGEVFVNTGVLTKPLNKLLEEQK